MKQLRLIFLFILSMALGLGEASASYSQAQMAGSRSLTICSPSGVREIRLGVNGEPIPSHSHNHSCCLFVANAVPVSGVSLLPRTVRLQGVVFPPVNGVIITISKPAKARSPPFVV